MKKMSAIAWWEAYVVEMIKRGAVKDHAELNDLTFPTRIWRNKGLSPRAAATRANRRMREDGDI